MTAVTNEKFRHWLECTDVRRFSRDLRNMLLEYSAMNTKVISDVGETFIDLLGLFEILDEAECGVQNEKSTGSTEKPKTSKRKRRLPVDG